MASSIGTAWIQIKPSMAGISKDIEKELGDAGTSGSKKLSSGLLGGLTNIGDKIGSFIKNGVKVASVAAGALIVKNIGGAFDRIDTLANYPKVMKNLGYETEDVAKSMKELEKGVKGLPTSLSDIVDKTQQLAPISGSLDQATKTALAFNNAALAAGGGQEKANLAFLQFSQILAKGKPDMQDWKSLQQVMPGQLSQVAKHLGIASGNTQELYDKMKEGTISTEDFRDAFISLNENGTEGFASFKDQASDATDGINTAMSNMEIAVQRAIASVVESIGKENIVWAIESIGNAFEWAGAKLGDFIQLLKDNPEEFEKLKNTLTAVGVALAILAVAAWAIAHPFTAIITLIGGIVTASAIFEEQIGGAIDTVYTSVSNFVDGAREKIYGFFGRLASWFSENVTGPIGGFFSGLWNGVKSGVNGLSEGIKSVFSTITGVIKKPINGVISGINGVLSSINSIKIPDWVPGLGGRSANFPMIPALYHGGIVTSPTIALVGDNPAGEAVIPLDELDRVGGGKPQIINNIGDIHIASDYDADRLLEQLGIKQDLYAKGAV